MSHAQDGIPHGRRRLRRIDRELRRSDPELAAKLAIFARLNAGEAMPGWEQLPPPPPAAPGWQVLLWPIAGAAFLVVLAAGGGTSTARGAAAACGTRRPGRAGDGVGALGVTPRG
jgi:hypothetical protein